MSVVSELDSSAVWPKRASIELERRIRAGEKHAVESVLAQFPRLADQRDSILEIIYLEYVLRQEAGEVLEAKDYVPRFPDLSDEIAKLLEVDLAMRSADAGDPLVTLAAPSNQAWGEDTTIEDGIDGEIGDYTLLEVIGRGGMGVVHRARQKRLGRMVAVKMLDSIASFNPTVVERFKAEAELAARLQHPNIVQIHEINTHSGTPFFSMELVAGGTLADATRDRPLQPMVAAKLLEVLARAVGYAHSQGVVHRDLKPANVLLAPSTRAEAIDLNPSGSSIRSMSSSGKPGFEPKIADFGLAKHLGAEAQRTLTGTAVGTPSYMAPEQVDSTLGECGPACDIYSLGAVLYSSLVGKPPFHAATALETMHQVRCDEAIPPRRILAKIPQDLETICLTCLRKEPRQRYATAEALADDLQRFCAGKPIRARPAGALERAFKWTRRHPSLAALVASISLATISLAGLWWRAEISRNAERTARQRGERLIYDRDFSLAQFEYRSHNVSRAREILGNSRPEFRNWEWHYLKKKCGQALWESPPDPQSVVTVSLNRDGSLVAIGRGQWGVNRPQVVEVWNIESNELVWKLKGHPDSQICAVQFSPDGQSLVSSAITWNEKNAEGGVVVWNVEDGSQKFRLAETDAYVAKYSPDGESIFVGATNGVVTQYSSASGEIMRDFRGAKKIVLDIDFHPTLPLFASSWRDGNLAVWNFESGERLELLNVSGDPRKLAWSKSGTKLLVAGYGGTLWTFDFLADRLELSNTQHRGSLPYIKYSPDGQQLATAAFGEGADLRDSKTGRVDRVFHGYDGHVRAIDFDSYGRLLATGCSGGSVQVWDLVRTESFPQHFSTGGASVAAMASCPQRPELALALTRNMAYADAASGAPRIELRDQHSMKLLRTLKGHADWPTHVAYSRDGERLVSAGLDKSVRVWNARTGECLTVFSEHRQTIVGAAFCGDGELVVSGDSSGRVVVWRSGSATVVRTWKIAPELVSLSVDALQGVLATASKSGRLALWNLADGRELSSQNTGYETQGILFSPDGKLLAVTGQSSKIDAWMTKDLLSKRYAQPAMTLDGHTNVVNCVSFSPDSLRLVSSSRDESVKVFDLSLGNELLSLDKGKGAENLVIFTRDGAQITRAQVHRLSTWSIAPTTPRRFDRDSDKAKLEAIAWHNARANSAKQGANYRAAAFHQSALIDLQPEKTELLFARAASRTRIGDWQGARDDSLAALARKEDLQFRFPLVRAALAQGDLAEYQRQCGLMIDKVEESSDPKLHNDFGWLASLSSESGVDPEQIVAVLEKTLGKNANPTYHNTMALACYRADRHRDAIMHAFTSLRLDAQVSAPFDWIIIALAKARLRDGAIDHSKKKVLDVAEFGRPTAEFEDFNPVPYRDLAEKWLNEQYAKRRAGQKVASHLNMVRQVDLPLFNAELRETLRSKHFELPIEAEPAAF